MRRHRWWSIGATLAAAAAVAGLLGYHALAWRGSDHVPLPGRAVPGLLGRQGPHMSFRPPTVAALTVPELLAELRPGVRGDTCPGWRSDAPGVCWPGLRVPPEQLLIGTWALDSAFGHDWRAGLDRHTLTVRIDSWDTVCEHGADCAPAPFRYVLFGVPLARLPSGRLTVVVEQERGYWTRASTTVQIPGRATSTSSTLAGS